MSGLAELFLWVLIARGVEASALGQLPGAEAPACAQVALVRLVAKRVALAVPDGITAARTEPTYRTAVPGSVVLVDLHGEVIG